MIKNTFVLLLLWFVLGVSIASCQGQDNKQSKKMVSTLSPMSKRDILVGKIFPALKAQTLSKNAIVFPNDVAGKPTILCIAFVRDAQNLVDTWTAPILQKYGKNEVNFYEIPMIIAAWRIMGGMIDNGMRSGVPKTLHGNVATYYGSLSGYKKDLLMDGKKSCYLFLLDKNGVIQYVEEHAATPTKLAALYAAIEKMSRS